MDANLPQIPGITLQHEIARGGMGVVFAGRQDFLDRRVAVKFLSVELGGKAFAQRFQREAKILAGIKHPNIVSCHTADTTDDGQSYLVMEFIDGPSLKAWILENGPVPLMASLRLIRATAQALGHAHAMEVIHRDVKPENVLLETMTSTSIDMGFPFTPKLVDLGLARMTHEQAGAGLTSPGSVMGTPSTMSPEQFDDPDSVDFRTDIYGLGCCLYEMLVGRPAFKSKKLTEIVAAKRAPTPPDPTGENAGLPAAVGALVQQMLARDRYDRPASYKELDEKLSDLMKTLESKGEATIANFGGATRESPAPSGQPTIPSKQQKQTAPGFLNTGELDFLSAGGSAGPEPSRPAFQEPVPATAATATEDSKPGGSKRGLWIGIGIGVAVAAGGAIWFLNDSGNGGAAAGNARPAVEIASSPAGGVVPGQSFRINAAATDADGDELRYSWTWDEDVMHAVGRANSSEQTFELDDGLPGASFRVRATVRDGRGGEASASCSIEVAEFASKDALTSLSEWSKSNADDLWTPSMDRLRLGHSTRLRRGQPPRSLSRRVGDDQFWEWSGTVITGVAMGVPEGVSLVSISFGDQAIGIRSRTVEGEDLDDVAKCQADLVTRAAGDADWQVASKPLKWDDDPEALTEHRTWFVIRRERDRLTVELGKFALPSVREGENPQAEITAWDRVERTLTEDECGALAATGKVELAVFSGRCLFSPKLR